MKPENLQFYRMIMGRKPHYIFKQENKFYVFTDLDNETRGNFSIIDENEVEKLRELIIKKYLRDFHPRHLDTCNYETDREYREHRIRTICYILQAQGFLFQHDHGREIIFERTYINDSNQTSIRKNVDESEVLAEIKFEIKPKRRKLNKLKNAKKIIGFYVDEYWEKKKKYLAENKGNSFIFICPFCRSQKKLDFKDEKLKICPSCNRELN